MQSKQEILELITGLKLIAMDAKLVLADGKLDMSDIAVVTKIISQRDELVKAFTGFSNIKKEELTSADVMELIGALIEAAKEAAAA